MWASHCFKGLKMSNMNCQLPAFDADAPLLHFFQGCKSTKMYWCISKNIFRESKKWNFFPTRRAFIHSSIINWNTSSFLFPHFAKYKFMIIKNQCWIKKNPKLLKYLMHSLSKLLFRQYKYCVLPGVIK